MWLISNNLELWGFSYRGGRKLFEAALRKKSVSPLNGILYCGGFPTA